MGNNAGKSKDFFADLISKEIETSGDESQGHSSDHDDVIDISSNSKVQSLGDLNLKKTKTPDLAPPPPIGKNGPVVKEAQTKTISDSMIKKTDEKPPTSAKVLTPKDFYDDTSFENHQDSESQIDESHSVEVSEIFSSEAVDVIRNTDKTQKLPIAEPFDVVPISSHEKFKPTTKNMGDLQEHLKSSNYLEVAQNRVLELEKEVQKLRRDGEQLAAAGKHFKELTETLKSQVKQAESNYLNLQEISKEEKKILMQSLEAKEIKISALQERVLDVEQRQGSHHENIRVRERELENRLEIMKSENEALTQSKDEMILELKKQLSSVNSDIEKYRLQNQKMMAKFESKEELLRRTVKALRIALTMLEGSQVDED